MTASQHWLSRFRGIINGRSTLVRRSSIRVTGFCASRLLETMSWEKETVLVEYSTELEYQK